MRILDESLEKLTIYDKLRITIDILKKVVP